jgi:hypothetical protein
MATQHIVTFMQLNALTTWKAEHCRWAVECRRHCGEKGSSRNLGCVGGWFRGRSRCGIGGDVATIDLELATAKVGVGAQSHPGFALHVVPLLRDVFTQGDGEFLQQGGLYVGKAFTVVGAELDEIAVGHYASALGIDISLGIHHLQQFATQLQGLDPGFEGTGKEAIKEVLH